MFKKILLVVTLALFSFGNSYAASNQILITYTDDRDKVIYDGKWSFTQEWKKTSLDTFSYNDNTVIHLRTAHQGDFIYIFADAVTDFDLDKGMDRAIVCFDSNNDKSLTAMSDDYCFMAVLDGKHAFTLQGGSPIGLNGNFKTIPNPEGFIGISAVSDHNDHYTKTPHPGYEFKIPINLLGRNNIYGFYFSMYDSNSNKLYSWPTTVVADKPFAIPSPNQWGEMISPDNSLPEFEWPLLALPAALAVTIYLSKLKKNSTKENYL